MTRVLCFALFLTLWSGAAWANPMETRWIFNAFENECVGPAPDHGQIRLAKMKLVSEDALMRVIPLRGVAYVDPTLGLPFFDFYTDGAARARELNCGVVAQVENLDFLLSQFRQRERYREGDVSLEDLPIPAFGDLATFRSTLHEDKMGIIIFAQGSDVAMISTWGTR